MYFNNGNGFDQNPTPWLLPSGGFNRPNLGNVGFVTMEGPYATQGWEGSNNWTLMDMDHDGMDDLVVTSEQDAPPANYAPVFGLPNHPHWRVHHNNGTRFEANYSQWTLPHGGFIDGTEITGFDFVYPLGGPPRGIGSEYWDVLDMDGDGLVDLLVTAVKQTEGYGWFGYQPDNNPYWRVFLSNGSGFDTVAQHWPIPYGGRRMNGVWRGFVNTQDNAIFSDEINSHNWILRDLNADQRPDFILTGKKRRTDADGIVFGLDSLNNTHWKVFWNTAAALGESESTSAMDMRIYPNPAKDVLHIAAGDASGHLRIVDLQGRSIYAAEVLRGQTLAIPVDAYATGLYLVEFTHAKGTVTRKFSHQ